MQRIVYSVYVDVPAEEHYGQSKLKYDTSVIRHLLLKVDSPSLEDSLLLVESREAKKAPQEDESSQEKPKVIPAEKTVAAEPVTKEESKDGEK